MEKYNLSVGLRSNDMSCGEQQPKNGPFIIYHNGVDGASVINQKGEDVTEYFNIGIEHGMLRVDFKQPPTYDEWRKVTGKQ